MHTDDKHALVQVIKSISEYADTLAQESFEGQTFMDKVTPYIGHARRVKQEIFTYLLRNKFATEVGDAYDLITHFDMSVNDYYTIFDIVALGADIQSLCADRNFTSDWYLLKLKEIYPEKKDNFFFLCKSALNALTHSDKEAYLSHIARAKKDPLARIVKICDLTDRINWLNLKPKNELSLRRYQMAKNFLLAETKE